MFVQMLKITGEDIHVQFAPHFISEEIIIFHVQRQEYPT